MGQITVKKLAKSYSERGVTTQIFSKPEEAKKWLESCP
jgi:hypothetical protein